jgi:hypothetical protein
MPRRVIAEWGNGERLGWSLAKRPRMIGSWAMQQLPYGFDHYARGGMRVRWEVAR